MKLFYIKAKIVIRVRNVSGPIEKTISHLVRANDALQARAKFEAEAAKECNQAIINFAGSYDSLSYDYLEVATEI